MDCENEAAAWLALWNSIRGTDTWACPWLDDQWDPGNPIFSARSAQEPPRAIRVILHDESDAPVKWFDKFARGTTEEIRELVLSVPHGAAEKLEVRRWLVDWVQLGGADFRSHAAAVTARVTGVPVKPLAEYKNIGAAREAA